MKHERIEIKLYNLDTFKKQIDVNFIDLDSELVDLNYKVESLIFCHFWRSIIRQTANRKRQFAVTRFQFRVAEISNFSKAFSSVQFNFIWPKYNTIQKHIKEL